MAIYTLDGTDREIPVLGRYASVKNNGDGTVYASSTPDLDALEAPGIVPIVSGESAVVRDCKKKLYVRGNGQIAVVSANQPFNFFESAPKGGGGDGGSGGGITQQDLNDTLKVYATNESVDTKLGDYAEKSDIPVTLPANGGNADTLDGKHASDFEQAVDWKSTAVSPDTAVNAGSYTFLTGDFNTGDRLEVRFTSPTAYGPNGYYWKPSPTVYLTIPAVGAATNRFAFADGTIPDVYIYLEGAETKVMCVLFTRTEENKLRFDGEKYDSQQGMVTKPAWIKIHGMVRDQIYWRVIPK